MFSFLAPSFLKKEEGQLELQYVYKYYNYAQIQHPGPRNWPDVTVIDADIRKKVAYSLVHIIISYNLPDINIVEAIIQIEIDESLKALYTRSDKGSIQVYDLSSDGKTVTKVAEMSSTSITKTAANILK